VPLGDPAVEGALVAQDEGEDEVAILRFFLVGRGVAAQCVGEGLVGIGAGHGSGILVDPLPRAAQAESFSASQILISDW